MISRAKFSNERTQGTKFMIEERRKVERLNTKWTFKTKQIQRLGILSGWACPRPEK
jgi:hypothetical protein